MKKIFFSFVFIFLLFVQVPLYIEYNVSELEGFFNDNCFYTDIKSTGDIKNIKEFSEAVSNFSEKEDAFVVTLSYSSQPDGNELTELFVSGNNIPDFLQRKGLTNDLLNRVYDRNYNSDISLSLFAPNKNCIIQNFEQLSDKSLSRMYYVYPSEKGNNFQQYMIENYNVDFFTSDELIYVQEEYIEQIPGVALMMAALLVFFAFWVVTQSQLNAVKKLHGYSDCQNICAIFGQFTLVTLRAVICCFALQFVFCGLYNRWISYFNIALDTLHLLVPIIAILIITGLLFSFLFYSSDIKYALKGRRPYKVLNACAVILKIITIIFLCYSVISIGNGMNQTTDILKQNDSFTKVKNCHFTEIRLTSGSSDYMSRFEKNGSNFYKALDGILINNRNVVDNRQSSFSLDDVMANTIFLNKNYLDINPIYDSEAKEIKVDENLIEENQLIVLVPEKYKSQEDKIYQQFYDWYKNARYVTIPTTELPKEQRNVSVDLVYVKDNQNYFAFDTDEIDLAYNNIKDPFAAIVTKNNMDNSYYSNYIVNKNYLLFENENQSMEKIYSIADQTGVSEDLVNIPTVASTIDILMQQCRNQIILSTVFFFLTLFIVLLISIYTIKNYMEENKKLFFVKKMLGYHLIGIYGKFIFVSTLLQFVLFVCLKFMLGMLLKLWLPISISFSILDFIIMWITAIRYQKTLTKSVLKGEEL